MQKSKIKIILMFLLKVYAMQTPMMVTYILGTTLGSGEWVGWEDLKDLAFWQGALFSNGLKWAVGMWLTYAISLIFAIWALLPQTLLKIIRTRIDLKQMKLVEASAKAQAQQEADDLKKAFVAYIRHMKSIHISTGAWKNRSINVLHDRNYIYRELFLGFVEEYKPDIINVMKSDNMKKVFDKYFKNDIYEIYNKVH